MLCCSIRLHSHSHVLGVEGQYTGIPGLRKGVLVVVLYTRASGIGTVGRVICSAWGRADIAFLTFEETRRPPSYSVACYDTLISL
jgi:hypothetical protein